MTPAQAALLPKLVSQTIDFATKVINALKAYKNRHKPFVLPEQYPGAFLPPHAFHMHLSLLKHHQRDTWTN